MQMSFHDNELGCASEQHVADTIVRARKSWKTVKGKSEPVWPPHLEKALVQALLQYKPNDMRYARALGRFPKRNRFISDFIFNQTGVRRSPKQVGSRLQQLKDVTCGKQLLNHVASWSLNSNVNSASASPRSNLLDYQIQDNSPSPVSPLSHLGPSFHDSSDGSSPPGSSLYSPSTSYGSPPITPQVRNLNVFITFDPSASSSTGLLPHHAHLQPLKSFGGCLSRPETIFALDHSMAPLALAHVEPTASFTSRDPIAAQSLTTVWLEADVPLSTSPGVSVSGLSGRVSPAGAPLKRVHQCSRPLLCVQQPAALPAAAVAAAQGVYSVDALGAGAGQATRRAQRECFVYSTSLLEDSMWGILRRERESLSRYSITQELVCTFDTPSTRRGETFLCITYHFVSASANTSSGLFPPSIGGRSLGHGHGSISPASSAGSLSPASVNSSLLHPHSHSHSHNHAHSHGHGQSQQLFALQQQQAQQAQQAQAQAQMMQAQGSYAVHSHGYSQQTQSPGHGHGHGDDLGMVNMKNYFRAQPQSQSTMGSNINNANSHGLGLGLDSAGSTQGYGVSAASSLGSASNLSSGSAPYGMEFSELGGLGIADFRLSASPVVGELGLNQAIL